MRRSVKMLVDASLKTGVKPILLRAPIPSCCRASGTSTVDEPAKSLYEMLLGIDAIGRRLGCVADGRLCSGRRAARPAAAAILSRHGPGQCWSVRQSVWPRPVGTCARNSFSAARPGRLKSASTRRVAGPTSPVVLAEVRRCNPTGGGVGDRADVLAQLIAKRADGVVSQASPIRRRLEACYAAGIRASDSTTVALRWIQGSKPVTADVVVKFLPETADTAATARRLSRLAASILCFRRSVVPITTLPTSRRLGS